MVLHFQRIVALDGADGYPVCMEALGRLAGAALPPLRHWQPWKQSTGPKPEGKAKSGMRGFKGGTGIYSGADLGDNSGFRAFGSRPSARGINRNSGYQCGLSGTIAIQNNRIAAICC